MKVVRTILGVILGLVLMPVVLVGGLLLARGWIIPIVVGLVCIGLCAKLTYDGHRTRTTTYPRTTT